MNICINATNFKVNILTLQQLLEEQNIKKKVYCLQIWLRFKPPC